MPSETVVVFGVTGHVGTSITSALKKAGFLVKGITDDSSPESMLGALEGAYGCYIVTRCDFTDPQAVDNEISRGRAIGEACVKSGVKHVIYSTQMSVVRTIGMTARHMDSKAEVERHLKELGLNVTSVIVPLLYENLLETPLRPHKLQQNCYGIDIPMHNLTLYMMSADDIGPVIASVFCDPSSWLNKTISLCGDKRTVSELVAIFNTVCQPLQFTQKMVTADQWEKEHQFPGATDYKHMMIFYQRVDQRASLDVTYKLNPQTCQLQDWAISHREDILRALDVPDKPPQEPWAAL